MSFSSLCTVTITEYTSWSFPPEKSLKRSLITPRIIYFFILSYTATKCYSIKCKIRTLGRDTQIVQKFSKANIFQYTQQSEIPMRVDEADILPPET